MRDGSLCNAWSDVAEPRLIRDVLEQWDRPTPDEMRVIAAAFLHVRVAELIPYLSDVSRNASVPRTKYLARCPACDRPTFLFGQGRTGVVSICTEGCSPQRISAVIVERRLSAGEPADDVWRRADRALSGEAWNPGD
jgi:hypothetical protein